MHELDGKCWKVIHWSELNVSVDVVEIEQQCKEYKCPQPANKSQPVMTNTSYSSSIHILTNRNIKSFEGLYKEQRHNKLYNILYIITLQSLVNHTVNHS